MSSPEGKFSLGAIEILPGAQRALVATGQPAAAYLYRHQYDTPDDQASDDSVVSVFRLPSGETLIVITDEARMHTVVMTAGDAQAKEEGP